MLLYNTYTIYVYQTLFLAQDLSHRLYLVTHCEEFVTPMYIIYVTVVMKVNSYILQH